MTAVVARSDTRVLLRRAGSEAEFLRGQMMFPLLPEGGGCGKARLARTLELPRELMVKLHPAGEVRHAITYRRLFLRVVVVEMTGHPRAVQPPWHWVPAQSLKSRLINSLAAKIWARAEGKPPVAGN